MQVTVLGCGSSNGTPQIGCKCSVCLSDNPKNKRFRPSIFIEFEDKLKVLVDATPDLRSQALKYNINHVDALIITHDHADHVAGLDDIRYFAFKHSSKKIPIYLTDYTLQSLKKKFGYLFEKHSKIYDPIFITHVIDCYDRVDILDRGIAMFKFFKQIHGEIDSLGMRIGDFAYSTDFKHLEPKGYEILDGISNWIVDCQKYHWSPSHLNYELALKIIDRVKPQQAYLTHLAHDFCYDELSQILPKEIRPAFDGLKITC